MLHFLIYLRIPLSMHNVLLALLDQSFSFIFDGVDLLGHNGELHEPVNLLFWKGFDELFLEIAQQIFQVELCLLENYVVQVFQELRVYHLRQHGCSPYVVQIAFGDFPMLL